MGRDPANDWDQEWRMYAECGSDLGPETAVRGVLLDTLVREAVMLLSASVEDQRTFMRAKHPGFGSSEATYERWRLAATDGTRTQRTKQVAAWLMEELERDDKIPSDDVECPFKGEVDGTVFGNGNEAFEFRWECPVCNVEHHGDPPEGPDDY